MRQGHSIFWWEAAGAVFIILAGSGLHFLFEWSGYWRPMAFVAAVNESTWEHLKMAFWPGILWGAIEWLALRNRRRAIWSAKGLALVLVAILIVGLFESYTAILGKNHLALDIGIFCIAIIVGQVLSYFLISQEHQSAFLSAFGYVVLAAQLLAFSLFTFFPPEHELFFDPRSRESGIPARI